LFGGTIFSAADPFYPVLFHQIFTHRGYRIRVWAKSAQIQFLKPGRDTLHFDIDITEDDIRRAEEALNGEGKFVEPFTIEMRNSKGELCVVVSVELYIRNLDKY